MADKDMTARKSATLYNTADGPRSVFDADGNNHVVAPGGSVTADFTAGELDGLHGDLTTTKPKASAEATPLGSAPTDQTADQLAHDIEERATNLVKGKDRDELVRDAEALGLKVAKNDTPEQIALAVAQKELGPNE